LGKPQKKQCVDFNHWDSGCSEVWNVPRFVDGWIAGGQGYIFGAGAKSRACAAKNLIPDINFFHLVIHGLLRQIRRK
jgi:hypothetical protein